MKPEKKTCIITFNKDLKIQCEGDYFKATHGGWEESPESASFEINGMSFVKGGLLEFTDYCNARKPFTDLWETIEEMCIEEIESNISVPNDETYD